MGEQKPLKINPRQLKMEKWVSSKSVNLIAKIRYKVISSLQTKRREDHAKTILEAIRLILEPHRRFKY